MNLDGLFDLMIDPLSIGTPQHKKHTLCRGRLLTFPDPKVSRARRVMALLAKTAIKKYGLKLPTHGTPVRLELTMFYAIPKYRRRDHVRRDTGEVIRRIMGGEPCTSHACGDVDNKAKGIIDALTDAGCWADDKDVTLATLAKRWTCGVPRIRVEISEDTSCSDDFTAEDIRENARNLAEEQAAGLAPVYRPSNEQPDTDPETDQQETR